MLVLDEATSALDNATEHEITETLAGLNGSLTILIPIAGITARIALKPIVEQLWKILPADAKKRRLGFDSGVR